MHKVSFVKWLNEKNKRIMYSNYTHMYTYTGKKGVYCVCVCVKCGQTMWGVGGWFGGRGWLIG